VLCLDLFGLLFILFKLAVLPLIFLARKHFSNKTTNNPVANNSVSTDTDHIAHSPSLKILSEIIEDHGSSNDDHTDPHRENSIVQSKL
jgi:hypothetical protein